MGAKRALIVDDSKSARAFLSRILEKYQIDVDTAESAEHAIDYLGTHRPDVIFMDHLMPGMDGFQAVQAIKNNPRTATIPIMMYTSQEGELYLGQARALGAVGVLPKQIKPADVTKVLYQLRLLPDRRTGEQTSFMPVTVGGAGDSPAAPARAFSPSPGPSSRAAQAAAPQAPSAEAGEPTAVEGATPATASAAAQEPAILPPAPPPDAALREQLAELRRAIVGSLDTQAERITAEVRAMLLDSLPPNPPATVVRTSPGPWIVAAVAIAIASVAAFLGWREAGARRALEAQVAQLRAAAPAGATPAPPAAPPAAAPGSTPAPGQAPDAVAPAAGQTGSAARAAPAAVPTSAAATATAPAAAPATTPAPAAAAAAGAAPAANAPPPLPQPVVEAVAYGEESLGSARVEAVRKVLARLADDKFRGTVEVRTVPGRFCLVGSAADGYSLAPDDLPQAKCDLVGNPQEAAGATPSLPLANLIASVRKSSGGAIAVRTVGGDPGETVAAYPKPSESLTAGEWNKAAAANNRVEIRWR